MVNYLEKLKIKCDISDELIDVIDGLFEKLIHFGYITTSESKKMQRKLYDNINVVLIGNDTLVDYKSGYYDAIKKELYIKDIKNIESIYLRIIYILSTNEISKEKYNIGYSNSMMSSKGYNIIHTNFGINRAIVSNLACRLLYTTPTTLSIMPTYRTYENDFLGNKLTSDNDIYFIEGKLLSQICYTFGISEENLYVNLFKKNPNKYLDKLFSKLKLKNIDNLLKLFDDISREYSNYNKLCYLNSLLDKNYIEQKKKALTSDISDLQAKEKKIKSELFSAIQKLNLDKSDETLEEISISEQIDTLEHSIIDNISNIQSMLVNYLISNENKYSYISYAIKLKELKKMAINENTALLEAIYNIISMKLLNTFENTASNLTEKIKYSLINEILSSEKYIKIYKNLNFNEIHTSENDTSNALIAMTMDNSFLQLVEINDLNNNIKLLDNNTKSIKIENLKYILDNPSVTSDVHEVEMLYTKIKTKFNKFKDLRIENFYKFSSNNKSYILVLYKDTFNVLKYSKEEDIEIKLLKLSESYSIFSSYDTSNMPVIYKKNENKIDKLLSFLAIFT